MGASSSSVHETRVFAPPFDVVFISDSLSQKTKEEKNRTRWMALPRTRATATELLLTTFHLGPLHVDAVTMVRTTSVERISWILKYVPSRRKPVDCCQGNNL